MCWLVSLSNSYLLVLVTVKEIKSLRFVDKFFGRGHKKINAVKRAEEKVHAKGETANDLNVGKQQKSYS